MAGHFARDVSSRVSKCYLIEELGSVNLCWLTMRAADKWESARFSGFWLAWGWFRFQSESTLPPLAANAGRWVLTHIHLFREFFK